MREFKTLIIYTTYPETLSFNFDQIEQILASHAIQVRDKITNVKKATLDPADVVSLSHYYLDGYCAHQFTPGADFDVLKRIY
jgi:hypothetical protein